MSAMGRENACKVYEQISAMGWAGDGIRPGGLELTSRALACCGFSPSSRILDVGCGAGVTLDQLTRVHEFTAVGIDSSSALLDQGRTAYPCLQFVRASGENLPFADKWADGVLSECVLSIIRDTGRAVDEFRRVLKIGGRLILSDVYVRDRAGADQLSDMPVDCCLRGAVAREELVDKLTRRGFEIDLWEDHSDALTRFAVKLVLSCGSMKGFWLRTGPESMDPDTIQRAISRAKPGYFLLIAHRSQ